MSQSYYSWCGTRLHIPLEDELARAFNRADNAFVKAQEEHKRINGKEWDPGAEPLTIDWTLEEQLAWNYIADVINLLCKINGGRFIVSEAELTSRKLIKL